MKKNKEAVRHLHLNLLYQFNDFTVIDNHSTKMHKLKTVQNDRIAHCHATLVQKLRFEILQMMANEIH
jgi:hypothetical protein